MLTIEKFQSGLLLQTISYFHALLKWYGVLYCKEIFYSTSFFWHFEFHCSLSFTSITLFRYWTFLQFYVTTDNNNNTELVNITRDNESLLYCQQHDVYFIKTYLVGVNAIVALNLPLLLVMISNSARGSICDIRARNCVTPLLYLK